MTFGMTLVVLMSPRIKQTKIRLLDLESGVII